jgi:hypothetical protein
MGETVTDPALLARLEAQAAQPGVVTDPKLIAKLEGQSDPPLDVGDALSHGVGQIGKGVANAAFAIPGMAMDAGVGLRNTIGDAYNKAAGNPATPDYELPSVTWNRGMDEIFGAPRNKMDKVTDAVLPMIVSAGASLSGAPALLKNTLAAMPSTGTALGGIAGPEAGAAAINFLSPTEQKRQALIRTLQASQELGLKVPRATSNPTAMNQAVETVGGKIATAQRAATENQAVANRIGAEYVGLDPTLPNTPSALQAQRAEAGQGYQAVRHVGSIETDEAYRKPLYDMQDKYKGMASAFPGSKPSPILKDINALDVQHFPSSPAVDKIIALRDNASAAYRAGENSLGADYKTLATNLENQIDRSLSNNPNLSPDVISNFRNSRALIAKTHTIEDAMGPNGDISIAKLAQMRKNGEYMTGDVAKLADFGNTFKKAAQSPAAIGSAGVNHTESIWPVLGSLAGTAFGGHEGHGAAGGIVGAGLGLGVPIARRLAIARALSESGQKAAIPALNDGFFSTASPKSATALAQALAQLPTPASK